MTDSIDITGYPYFNRYNSDSNYKLVLPYVGGTVQPRDLIEAQATVQDQITRISDTLYQDGTIIKGCEISVNSNKTQVTITSGQVYLEGWVETFSDTSVVTITGSGLEVIGLVKTESLVTDVNDLELRNPATNFDLYDPAGSYRLQVTWSWALLTDEVEGLAVKVIGILTLTDGSISSGPSVTVDNTQAILNQMMALLASRDYEQSGNYIIEGLNLNLVSHPQYPWDMKQIVVKSGTARILGIDTTLQTNWTGNLPVARDTSTIQNEPWIVTVYDPITESGGQRQLGEKPVASVQSVVATVLFVEGYGDVSRVTRGPISGGSDQLIHSSIVQIMSVNQGGTWNPLTETFTGGVTFSPSTYMQDGNSINWSPLGNEPAAGSSYSVAYQYRATLTKQLMEMTQVSNESLSMGTDDTIDHPYMCETNTYTGLSFRLTNLETTDSTTSDYVKDDDFSVSSTGVIDWYNHQVQEFIIPRVTGSFDIIDPNSVNSGYEIERVLSIASTDGEFDTITNTYISGTNIYSSVTDYEASVTDDGWKIDWTPASTNNTIEPPLNSYYRVAVMEKIPKSSNHPELSNEYFASYYYWKVVVSGDYLSRDSFYITYDETNPSINQLQHYGLDLQDYINLWISVGYNSGLGNMGKPYPGSMIEVDYTYYLSRYALINYTNNATITVTLGTSSDSPTEPGFDKNISGVMLGTVYMPADGLNMVLHEFEIVTLKVTELQSIKSKVTYTEIALAMTVLEMQAKSLPISNKMGVSTSAFLNNDIFDDGWSDQKYSIDPDWEKLTLPHSDSFYSTTLDSTLTTGSVYTTISTLVPVGVNTINQESATYNDSVSLAPVFASQSMLQYAQSTPLNLNPPGDFLVIPRSESAAVDDSDVWRFSKISKLDDPSPWFAGGWRGNQGTDQTLASASSGTDQTVTGEKTSVTNTNSFIKGVSGKCRQIPVAFYIGGGLPDPNANPVDFYLYFGGIQVAVTPTDGTPAGSVAGTFAANQNRSASGTFVIPPNVSAGQIEVKVISTPIVVNNSDWQYVSSSIYNVSVESLSNNLYNSCRCNCYSCNRCANCWSCSGRCGTGPLTETVNITDPYVVIRSIQLDFDAVSPKYGVIVSIINTENGQPTNKTVTNNMLGRKYLTPSALIGGWNKLFVFDDPIVVKSDTIGVLVSGEDGFNVNYARELDAGRDIRVNVSRFPSMDIYTHQGVNTKQFQLGSFWTSTGSAWSEDGTKDLTFKAYLNVYPINTSQVIYMDPITVSNATGFLCAWNSQVPEGTSAIFQYTIGDGAWYEFSPYVLTNLRDLASLITVRSILSTTDSRVTSTVENTCSIYVQSKDTVLYAVTDLFSLASGEVADELDIWIDSHLTSTYTQKLRVTFNDGVTWVDLDLADGGLTGQGFVCSLIDVVPINLNIGQESYTYHWKVTLPLGTHFTAFRTEFNMNTVSSQVTESYPYFSNYIAIPSTT